MMQECIRQGKLEEGHGKILAGIDDDRTRYRLFRSILRRNLSVRDASILAEKLISGTQPTKRPAAASSTTDPNVRDIEDRLRRMLSAQVKIKPKGKGGTIEVAYADWQDLDRIYWQIIGADGPVGSQEPK
jgi:ParB family chromosome partitioning protein